MTPRARKNKRLVGLFLLGCVFFNYPLLSLFNIKTSIFGMPLLFFYIFTACCLIALVFGWLVIPELKGKTLEQISDDWRRKTA